MRRSTTRTPKACSRVAGDPEVLQRRRGQARTGAAARAAVERAVGRRLRNRAQDRIPRRGRPGGCATISTGGRSSKPPCRMDMASPSACCSWPVPTRFSHRRRAAATDVAQARRSRSAGQRVISRGNGDSCAHHAGDWSRSRAAPPCARRSWAIASRARPVRHTSSMVRATREDRYVSSFVGLAPASAPRSADRRDARRARRRPILRRSRRGAGVQRSDVRGAADAVACRRMHRSGSVASGRGTARSEGGGMSRGSRTSIPPSSPR